MFKKVFDYFSKPAPGPGIQHHPNQASILVPAGTHVSGSGSAGAIIVYNVSWDGLMYGGRNVGMRPLPNPIYNAAFSLGSYRGAGSSLVKKWGY